MPVLIRQLKSCSHSSTVSRREMRLRTASVTTAACNRGPNALAATSAGSGAVWRLPHAGQATRWRRCSTIRTDITGSSSTWWRAGSPTATRSTSQKTCPQPHADGQCSTTSSTADAGSNGRPLPHARAARPPADPTDPCSATARSADPGSAAATNCATSAWPGAQAARCVPPAWPRARSAHGSAHPSATAPRPQPHGPARRPPPHRPAPHHGIRRQPVMSPHQLNAYGFSYPRATDRSAVGDATATQRETASVDGAIARFTIPSARPKSALRGARSRRASGRHNRPGRPRRR